MPLFEAAFISRQQASARKKMKDGVITYRAEIVLKYSQYHPLYSHATRSSSARYIFTFQAFNTSSFGKKKSHAVESEAAIHGHRVSRGNLVIISQLPRVISQPITFICTSLQNYHTDAALYLLL